MIHNPDGSVKRIIRDELRRASTAELVSYIEQDISALRFRMEIGSYPGSVTYDIPPAELIAAYATELASRGY